MAAALELSEDAVKQRLSRGRKLLQDQVAAFVEGALQRTAPGPAFTTSVLGVLPALTVPVAATTVAQGGAAVAHDFAVGGAAVAQHVNDDAARAFVQGSEFFRWAKRLSQYAIMLLWLPMGLVIGQVLGLRRKR